MAPSRNNPAQRDVVITLCSCSSCLSFLFYTLLISCLSYLLIDWILPGFYPQSVIFHVSDSPAEFYIISNSTLKYDVNLTMSAYNPNKYITFYYDSIKATVYYGDGHVLGEVSDIPPFVQGRGSYVWFEPLVFKGVVNATSYDELITNVLKQMITPPQGMFSFRLLMNLQSRCIAGKYACNKARHFEVECQFYIAARKPNGISRSFNCSNGPTLKWSDIF